MNLLEKRTLLRMDCKIIRAEELTTFLRECRKNRVYPMSVFRIKLPIKSKTIEIDVKNRCLKFAITDTRRNVFAINKRMNDYKRSMFKKYGTPVVHEIDDLITNHTGIRNRIRAKYVKKLKWIFFKQISKKAQPSLQLEDVAMIVGDMDVPPPIKTLLTKGPMMVPHIEPRISDLAPHIDHLINEYDDLYQEKLRWELVVRKESRNKRLSSIKEKALIRYTKDWMRDNSITCTRDDKSKKIIIIHQDVYHSLLEDFITNSNSIELMQDPTDKYDNKVNALIRSKGFPKTWKVERVDCPFAPRLFGYIKGHKNPISIRPMVDKKSSPVYELEKKNCFLGRPPS